MATLKTIVTEYINLLDKPFDIALYNRVRQLVLNQRAFELSKQAERFGIDNTVIQYIEPEFELVKNNLNITISDKEDIIKTTNKVLRTSIRLSREAPFVYVGSIQRTLPFMNVNNKHTVARLRNTRYFSRVPLYYVEDSFVYCIVKKGTINLAIGNAWLNPGEIDLMNNYIEEEYFDDNYEFLISPSMLQVIKEKLLKGELGILQTDDKEVKVNEDIQEKQK